MHGVIYAQKEANISSLGKFFGITSSKVFKRENLNAVHRRKKEVK